MRRRRSAADVPDPANSDGSRRLPSGAADEEPPPAILEIETLIEELRELQRTFRRGLRDDSRFVSDAIRRFRNLLEPRRIGAKADAIFFLELAYARALSDARKKKSPRPKLTSDHISRSWKSFIERHAEYENDTKCKDAFDRTAAKWVSGRLPPLKVLCKMLQAPSRSKEGIKHDSLKTEVARQRKRLRTELRRQFSVLVNEGDEHDAQPMADLLEAYEELGEPDSNNR